MVRMRNHCEFCKKKVEGNVKSLSTHLHKCPDAPFHEIIDELQRSLKIQSYILEKIRED